MTHISQSSLDGVGVYVSAEFGSALRSFAFPMHLKAEPLNSWVNKRPATILSVIALAHPF